MASSTCSPSSGNRQLLVVDALLTLQFEFQVLRARRRLPSQATMDPLLAFPTIQLWTIAGTLIDRYEGHDGPVRGVTSQIAATVRFGGDDYRIKLWNYNQKRCLFTLTAIWTTSDRLLSP